MTPSTSADDFQQEVAFFGIESAPSFVREPDGNGVAERFIRTLKENLLWVRSFETIEELRLALLAFKRTYNEQWMLEKYDYPSPAQVRRDLVGLDAWLVTYMSSAHTKVRCAAIGHPGRPSRTGSDRRRRR